MRRNFGVVPYNVVLVKQAIVIKENGYTVEVSESPKNTVFENHRKSLIQHCERSELRLHFEWTKVN